MRYRYRVMRDASSGVDLSQVHIGRTPEGTVFETVCAVLVLVSWVAVVVLSLRGESVDAGVMVLNAVGGMVVTVLCLAAAYHPLSTINLPFTLRTVGQVVLMSRLARVVAVGVAVLSLVQTCMVGGLCSDTVLWICLACLIVAVLVCSLSVYRAGRVLIQNHENKHN